MDVSVTLVRSLFEELARNGDDPAPLLARAGVDLDLLDDPNARLDAATYDRLHELALELTGDPALGLHMAEHVQLTAFHVVGFLTVHCRTLRQAIELFARYRQLLSHCEPPRLREEGGRAILTCAFVAGSDRCNQLRAEFGIASMVRIARAVLGASQPPYLVEFTHDAPDHADEYERVLGCPVQFGREAIVIHFDARMLDAPHIHANPELRKLLESEAERHLASLTAPRCLWARVRALIVDEYGRGRPSMPQIARRLGMSARSLRRRLDGEGRTYTEVAEEAMADVARRLLDEPDTTIQAIADRLGFSEPSAFHRAFKRWTGQTPGQFRSDRGTLPLS